MASRRRWALIVGVLALAGCDANRFVSGWIPYWNSTSGRATIENSSAALLYSDVSPMWYGTAADGSIVATSSTTTLATTVAAARAQGLPVIPAIFDGTATGVMSAILANPTSRANHIQKIVDLVVAKGYDGIDLDYEVFAFGNPRSEWATITPNWISFVNALSAQLHAKGKLLSVTIPPTWMTGTTSSGYSVYAQAEIAAAVDRLRLMVYDWSVFSPGPIGPISWINDVISYSSSRVPVSKLQLGVPAYGRHWATQKSSAEVCPDGAIYRDSITMKAAPDLAASKGQTPLRHASGEMTFSWTERVTGPRTKTIPPPIIPIPPIGIPTIDLAISNEGLQPALRLGVITAPVTCTVQHTVYYPDAANIRQRADAAAAANWSGIIIWALGYEVSDVYAQLAGVGPQRPNGSPTGAIDPIVGGPGTIRVTGFGYDPEFDLPASVTVTVTATAGGAAVSPRTVVANVQRSNMPDGLGPFHGFDQTFSVAAGSYSVCVTLRLWDGTAGLALGCQAIAVAAAASPAFGDETISMVAR